ncbi:hypothetical protein SUDANB70_03157 [Streptomyces sp. enrichment culture]
MSGPDVEVVTATALPGEAQADSWPGALRLLVVAVAPGPPCQRAGPVRLAPLAAGGPGPPGLTGQRSCAGASMAICSKTFSSAAKSESGMGQWTTISVNPSSA